MTSLASSRTTLRRPQITDTALMRELDSDSEVVRYTPMRVPQSEEQTKTRFAGQLERQDSLEPYGVWLAHLRSDGSFLGWFMLMPQPDNELELGFMIVQRHWNQGYTTEVTRTLIEYTKNLGHYKTLVAKTDVQNTISIRTLEKLGFVYEETKIVPERYLPGEFAIKIFRLNLA